MLEHDRAFEDGPNGRNQLRALHEGARRFIALGFHAVNHRVGELHSTQAEHEVGVSHCLQSDHRDMSAPPAPKRLVSALGLERAARETKKPRLIDTTPAVAPSPAPVPGPVPATETWYFTLVYQRQRVFVRYVPLRDSVAARDFTSMLRVLLPIMAPPGEDDAKSKEEEEEEEEEQEVSIDEDFDPVIGDLPEDEEVVSGGEDDSESEEPPRFEPRLFDKDEEYEEGEDARYLINDDLIDADDGELGELRPSQLRMLKVQTPAPSVAGRTDPSSRPPSASRSSSSAASSAWR